MPNKNQNGVVHRIFEVNESSFQELALEVFNYQYNSVNIYKQFCDGLKKNPSNVQSITEIPFLPVSFFKSNEIIAEGKKAEAVFESSGTTKSIPSKHFVADLKLYEKSFTKSFETFYGSVSKYVLLALLPSYLERKNSSLIFMANSLIEQGGKNASGFFLNEYDKLYDMLDVLKTGNRKTILLGVTFALLEFADRYKIDYPDLIVMETGGMKGRSEERTREEVHTQMRTAFDVQHIHSEYGMTELLSQAYSKGEGKFFSPAWMKIFVRDVYEPSRFVSGGETGGVNIVDLANLYSCSFIATDDIGKINADGGFEILGRTDSAELRGCNLMVNEI